MESFIRDQNIRITEDVNVFGNNVPKGTKIKTISTLGEYNGYQLYVPPPEFEALFIDHALSASLLAKKIKSKILDSRNELNNIPCILISSENYSNFFEFSQNCMASIAFSISALESWANNTIQSHVDTDNKPILIEIETGSLDSKKTIKEYSNLIPSNRNFSISRKIFKVIPKIFKITEPSQHNKMRKEITNLINERNTIMHMQDENSQKNKIDFAVTMYKREDYYSIDLVLKYLNYLYKVNDDTPEWIKEINLKRNSLK